ncbi:glycosyltransferase family 25 protein [Pseudorhodobacter sp. E13]|uniref:glycosyltransferase family 25 protein n=1 Tax=Pseudorhodobacter sp. E13 TaxID=2487931 RepID=UPI000F8CA492|nr:glycosyltransferase family 25 protein [Pseudorhodobacter sp. E13]RUS59126.1 glycosyltransferase family 25 protein [Pseudorhodobacter sp. E13]
MTYPRSEIAVFLINLKRSEKRRRDMADRLAQLGLPYTVFDAVDGRANWATLAPSVDIAAFERNTGRRVLPGEIGTYHSHLGVWQAFVDSGQRIALVLEDDVVFHDDFLSALDLAVAAVDQWDFLKLNKIRAKHPRLQGKIGPYDLNAYVGAATGLGAYLITHDLATRLLPAMLPITRPIDHELDRIFVHDFRHFGLEPFPSHVDDGNESTITGSSFSEVQKFPKWKRLPNYALRLRNLIGKAIYLARSRQR